MGPLRRGGAHRGIPNASGTTRAAEAGRVIEGNTPQSTSLAPSPPAARNAVFRKFGPAVDDAGPPTACAPLGRALPSSAVTARQTALTSRASKKGRIDGAPRFSSSEA
ncbi:hypothetical protein BC826DRAFT_1015964 [Russula brevipes]|nr:hypothetical protein BC826DRAFT_1015964 [Russula brevipes]